ncbi:MAG: hypothetical protein QW818_02615 [Candidatus Aenigmatarchaeota archaeon]|nr:hypothetical protein [Candidatus Aenigmarchaeota archaeon]
MRAFIAAPFTSRYFNRRLDEGYINFLDSIEAVVKESGIEPFNATKELHKYEEHIDAIEHNLKVLEELEKSDILIAYPAESRGVCIDLGIAPMPKKKIIVPLHEDEKVSESIEGLSAYTTTYMIKFKDIFGLKSQLKEALEKVEV